MPDKSDTVVVHASVELTVSALQTIVEYAKRKAGRNKKGRYQVDTAKEVSNMISRFLRDRDFERYVMEIQMD